MTLSKNALTEINQRLQIALRESEQQRQAATEAFVQLTEKIERLRIRNARLHEYMRGLRTRNGLQRRRLITLTRRFTRLSRQYRRLAIYIHDLRDWLTGLHSSFQEQMMPKETAEFERLLTRTAAIGQARRVRKAAKSKESAKESTGAALVRRSSSHSPSPTPSPTSRVVPTTTVSTITTIRPGRDNGRTDADD